MTSSLFFVGPIVCGVFVFCPGLSDVDIWAFSRLAITAPREREMVAWLINCALPCI